MPQSSRAERKKQKHLGRNLIVVFCVIAIVLAADAAVNRPNQNGQVSSTVSTVTTTLSPNDFEFASGAACGFQTTNGLEFLSIDMFLNDTPSLPFHYTSANIVLVNYTLADGTVVIVNRQYTDNNQTFATRSHGYNFIFYPGLRKSDPKVTKVELLITANIRELGEPLVQAITLNVAC